MKWDGDPLRVEKYLIFDAILEFTRAHEGEKFCNVSLKTLADFVDFFCEKYVRKEDGN